MTRPATPRFFILFPLLRKCWNPITVIGSFANCLLCVQAAYFALAAVFLLSGFSRWYSVEMQYPGVFAAPQHVPRTCALFGLSCLGLLPPDTSPLLAETGHLRFMYHSLSARVDDLVVG